MVERPSIVLNQAEIRWNLEAGTLDFFGLPAACFWLNPSLLRLLQPLERELGTALFRTLVAYQASLGTDEDYHQMVTVLGSSFPEGFLAWGAAVSAAGWGSFSLTRFDPDARRATVVVDNPWELLMQRDESLSRSTALSAAAEAGSGESALAAASSLSGLTALSAAAEARSGKSALAAASSLGWGCPFLQGKITGIFSLALGTTCWAEEASATFDPCRVVFEITPSQRTIERELAALRDASRQENERLLKVEVERQTARLQQAQEELLQARKLEALGVLAGGLAHDFNNHLTTILANLGLAQMRLAGGQPATEILEATERACLRASALTQQLLTFTRGGVPVRETADLRELIQDSALFTTRGSASTCVFDIDDDLWPVDVDRGQIDQVLQNLVLNAVQAMPRGGTIHIAARNVYGGDAGQRRVQITILDEGQGIPDDVLPSMFDPYFTTKKGGSGLGLATAYAIVDKHGGSIRVTTKLGEGSAFQIELPASESVPATLADVPTQLRGTERILIMDDEDGIRASAEAMLEHLGYRCVAVPDGDAAIRAVRRARAEGRPFDAVIMDLTVPGGKGGLETLPGVRALEPDLPVIVSSGYSTGGVMAAYRDHGFDDMLPKPWRVEGLARVLRRVLGAGHAGPE